MDVCLYGKRAQGFLQRVELENGGGSSNTHWATSTKIPFWID